MTEPWDVVVVVPARDEEDLVADCLRSVVAALRAPAVRRGLVVVVADACTDATAARARAELAADDRVPGHLVLEIGAGNVGVARGVGVEAGLSLLHPLVLDRTWIAATDADTRVPPDWLAHHLALARRGWSAVAGTVEVTDFSGLPAGTEAAWRADYEARVSTDGHDHVHGANLGCRADAYLDVGGWPPLSLAEDHALWGALRRRGWPAAASSSSLVMTSGRAIARAVGGFADALRSFGGGGHGSERDADRRTVPALG